jgi:hypothetical protein
MKNQIYNFLFLVSFVFAFQSCEVQDDNKVPEDIAINNFVWKGLNLYYLWQSDVANLADDRFGNQADLNAFLYGFPQPENLFQQLLNKPRSLYPNPGEAIDRFSVIFLDYNQLEGILSGTTKNNGAEFGLYYKDASQLPEQLSLPLLTSMKGSKTLEYNTGFNSGNSIGVASYNQVGNIV